MLTRLVDHDDSGSLTDGTPHDNAWLQRLNDTIDARWTVKVISATGVINDLDIGEADFVIFTNTADLLVNGILAPSSPVKPGKTIHLRSVAAGVVRFAHLSAACATASRLFNLVASGPTPITARVGVVTPITKRVTIGSLIAHEQGQPITVPYAAANFTGTGTGTWTVAANSQSLMYILRGTILSYFVYAAGPTGVALSGVLNIKLPEGYQLGDAAAVAYQVIRAGNSTGAFWGMVLGGGGQVSFWLSPGGAGWPVDASDLIQGLVQIAVK